MSTLRIETAGPEDATDIHTLIVELCKYEREDPQTTVKATPESLHRQLSSESPPFRCLIARRGDELLGFALYFFNYSTWRGQPGLYLEDLFIRPSARGQGLGRRLLRELAQIAVDANCQRMEWMVLDWNEPAIAFYRALGAELLDGWTTCRLTRNGIETLARSN